MAGGSRRAGILVAGAVVDHLVNTYDSAAAAVAGEEVGLGLGLVEGAAAADKAEDVEVVEAERYRISRIGSKSGSGWRSLAGAHRIGENRGGLPAEAEEVGAH